VESGPALIFRTLDRQLDAATLRARLGQALVPDVLSDVFAEPKPRLLALLGSA
jgi:hypothetical protein